ncbi:MAG: hypothetical protein LBK69_00655, partial [Syntrophomonadaceae bacterium]|nr:hypothetical protein [Syntrophomonadaceae bacterium]
DLVGNFFGRKLERRIPLIVYKDSVSLASGFKWGRDQKAAGVYWRGTIGILSPRLYVKNTKQVQRNFLKQGPVVHELVHLWVDDMTQGNYTRWWSEGVAQYVERELTGFAFGNPFVREREFDYYTLEELENGFDDLDKSIAYWESLKFIDFIVKEHGPGCVVEIVNALRRNEKMSQVVEGVTSIRYDMLQKLFYQELDINEREV